MWGEANNMGWLGSPPLLKLVVLMVNLLGFPGQTSIGGTSPKQPMKSCEHPSFSGAWERQGRKGHLGANEWGRAPHKEAGWCRGGEERLAMCSCCNALLQQTCPEQQWASWLACLFQRNACTGRLSPDCDSLQSLWWIDQGKKRRQKG